MIRIPLHYSLPIKLIIRRISMGHRLLVGVSINPAPEPSIDDDPFVWIVQGVSISLGLGSASGAQVDSTIKSA